MHFSMHFWIDKRANSYQYANGRRRPTVPHGRPLTFSPFGPNRQARPHRPATSSSLTPAGLAQSGSTTRRETVDLHGNMAPLRFTSPPRLGPTTPAVSTGSSRQSSAGTTYRSIPDPDIRQALDELDAELRASFPPPEIVTTMRSKCFQSKQLGLCLCFMGFILLCTVAGKFIVEGPGIIDASRRPNPVTISEVDRSNSKPSVSFFFASEIIFVAFALGLFFVGVTCLRKRTNAYLLRQFRQHIITTHQDDPGGGTGSGSTRSSGATTVTSEEDTGLDLEPATLALLAAGMATRRGSRAERRASRYFLDVEAGLVGHPGRNRRCYNYTYGCQQLLKTMQRPPPYEVALYLPRPNQQLPQHTLQATDVVRNDELEKGQGDLIVAGGSASPRTETPPPPYEPHFTRDI